MHLNSNFCDKANLYSIMVTLDLTYTLGDYGETFYIILRGKVSVLIPNYVKSASKKS